MSRGDQIHKEIMDKLVTELQDCKGEWNRLAKLSGVPYMTIVALATRKVKNPHIKTLCNLSRYLGIEMSTIQCPHFNKYPS